MEISTFLSLNGPSLHSGQFRNKKSLDLHEKSLDLSNYEIFPHKILKPRTFKKSSILIVIKDDALKRCYTLHACFTDYKGTRTYEYLSLKKCVFTEQLQLKSFKTFLSDLFH
jgi:hypothetical protein